MQAAPYFMHPERIKKMDFYITNAQVYHNHHFGAHVIHVTDGKIKLCTASDVPQGAETFDAQGRHVIPGFIDIHTHGAVGVDVNTAGPEDLHKIGRFFASNGTTSWLGSVLTDTEEQTQWCIEQFKAYDKIDTSDAAHLLGIHLEGPFLASAYKGAMPEHLLQQGNTALLRHYQELAEGRVKYMTVSPEVSGVTQMIPDAKKLGIRVGIGHSGATYQQAMEAIENGATLSTHTFNAMRLFHQHEPAIMGAVLASDEVYCEMICDGLHLVPATVNLLVKIKGLGRVIGITDSIMAAGLPDGHYHLGVNDVVVKDGDAKLESDGTRAGSTLTLNRGLKNIIAFTGKTLEEVIPALTENPAKFLGMEDHIGFIDDGMDADLVLLDEDNNVAQVFVKGNLVSKEA